MLFLGKFWHIAIYVFLVSHFELNLKQNIFYKSDLVQYSVVQFSAVQYSVVQFSAVQYSVVPYSAVQ